MRSAAACPICKQRNTRVTWTRKRRGKLTKGHLETVRRRKCRDCGFRWSTCEVMADSLDYLIKELKRQGIPPVQSLDHSGIVLPKQKQKTAQAPPQPERQKVKKVRGRIGALVFEY